MTNNIAITQFSRWFFNISIETILENIYDRHIYRFNDIYIVISLSLTAQTLLRSFLHNMFSLVNLLQAR